MTHSDASHHPSECFLSPQRKHFFDGCKASGWGIDDVRMPESAEFVAMLHVAMLQ